MEQPESGILQQLAQGSPEAIEAIYDRYGAVAFAVAMRVLSDQAAAEDVVQEAFLSIWRRSATYRPERGTLRNWICTIVRNRAIDKLRGDAGRVRYELPLDERPDEPGLSDTWAAVAAELGRQQVRAALQELPVEQRQTIELAYWVGLSQREIADSMEVPLGTVKGRARLALARLREMLQERKESWQT